MTTVEFIYWLIDYLLYEHDDLNEDFSFENEVCKKLETMGLIKRVISLDGHVYYVENFQKEETKCQEMK